MSSCSYESGVDKDGDYLRTNINIYKDTPAWELAEAVNSQNVKKISEICKSNPELINYQDQNYGVTLLLWSVGMEKYNSAEALLIAGADPNIPSKLFKRTWGTTPLFTASGYSWIDNVFKKDAKYVKLLLSYGADPNWKFTDDNPNMKCITETGTTPLIESIGCGLEKTKALVEAGADIEAKTESGNRAVFRALQTANSSLASEALYAHYLIVEMKADITEPKGSRFTFREEFQDLEFYPVTNLRDWICDLESKSHKIKMEIVEEFKRQGVDYWSTPISNKKLDQIKKLYPDTWEDYIKVY
tara:strand:- start:1493 stop:2395 length:903 start_codon:yes stop_codon:yes gene_type:complete